MGGGSADHSGIAWNTYRALDEALENTPCWPYNSDMAVRLSQVEYRFPAVTVTCDERDRGRARELQSPRVVLEGLSHPTEKEDRTTKSALDPACPRVPK